MTKMISKIVALKNDRKAVTALEYGIIAGVLGLTLIVIFTTFGGKLDLTHGGAGLPPGSFWLRRRRAEARRRLPLFGGPTPPRRHGNVPPF
jgi:Flp pilus assembly pilin Flp